MSNSNKVYEDVCWCFMIVYDDIWWCLMLFVIKRRIEQMSNSYKSLCYVHLQMRQQSHHRKTYEFDKNSILWFSFEYIWMRPDETKWGQMRPDEARWGQMKPDMAECLVRENVQFVQKSNSVINPLPTKVYDDAYWCWMMFLLKNTDRANVEFSQKSMMMFHDA